MVRVSASPPEGRAAHAPLGRDGQQRGVRWERPSHPACGGGAPWAAHPPPSVIPLPPVDASTLGSGAPPARGVLAWLGPRDVRPRGVAQPSPGRGGRGAVGASRQPPLSGRGPRRSGTPAAADTPPPRPLARGGRWQHPPATPHGTRAAPRGAAAEPVFSAPAVAVGMAACTTYPIVHGPHPPPPARAICALPSLDRPRPSAPLPPSHHPRSLPPQVSPPSPPSPAIPPLSCHPPWPLRLYLPAAFLLPRPPDMASEAAHRR